MDENGIAQRIQKMQGHLRESDPLKGIPDDWVCVVHPSQVYDLCQSVPEEHRQHSTQPQQLQMATGRRTYVENHTGTFYIAYMSTETYAAIYELDAND